MSDLGNRTAVNAAIDLLLDDLQPDGNIQPSDHNGLLKDVLDTLANGLFTVLRTENSTQGLDIILDDGGSLLFENSGFNNTLDTQILTADRNTQFPDKSGVVALLSDITGGDGIYGGSNTVPTSVVATITDSLTFENGELIVKGVGTIGSPLMTYYDSTNDVLWQWLDDGNLNLGQDTSFIMDSGNTALKLGDIFTGSATNGVLKFQGDNTSYNAIEFFSATATNSSGRNFAIGLDSIGYANVGGKNNLILSSDHGFNSTNNRIWVRGSARDVLFQSHGRTYVSLKENGDMYIDPDSGYGLGIGLTSPEARLHVKGEHDDLVFRAETSGGVNVLDIDDLGNINMSNLPTTSAGLSSGDLWNDSGTLKIV